MNYATIKPNDIANGPGVRVSLFVSGCNHHCEGCFNEVAWDFNYGDEFTDETEKTILDALSYPHIKGLTLLGGEPMEFVNQTGLLPLVKRVRQLYPEKTIWCYTGFLFDRDIMGEMMKRFPVTQELVPLFDVMVDGKFELANKDIRLRFKGSTNQRILDVKKSLEAGEVVLWEDESDYYTK